MFIRLEKKTFLKKEFWTATVTGTELSIETGRIGRSGTVTTHSYDSVAVAWQRAEEQAAHKVDKGFVEVARHDPEPPAAGEPDSDAPSLREQVQSEDNGWNAIDRALATLYGDQEPVHWAPAGPGPAFEGGAPLNGVSAFDAGDHWHYVGYGLTDLFENSDPNWERSNYGFELTFRLAKRDEPKPPPWAATLLHGIARAQRMRDRIYTSPSALAIRQPIDRQPGTALTNVLLIADPELPEIDTPHGLVEFLQVVGITEAEMNVVREGRPSELVETLRAASPRLITDIQRARSEAAPPSVASRAVPDDVAQTIVSEMASMGPDDTREIPSFGRVRTSKFGTTMRRSGQAANAAAPWSVLGATLDAADAADESVSITGLGTLYPTRRRPFQGQKLPTVWQLRPE